MVFLPLCGVLAHPALLLWKLVVHQLLSICGYERTHLALLMTTQCHLKADQGRGLYLQSKKLHLSETQHAVTMKPWSEGNSQHILGSQD